MESTFLLENWKFIQDDPTDAWNRGYADGEWTDVIVPHDWSVLHPFSTEHSSGTGYLPGGTGWYRARFTLPSGAEGDRVLITFDGIYKNSQVWCNSNYLGKRPFGYATFTYDISDYVFADGRENIVAVRVSHEDIADSRWFTGSGIYRKVSVRVCPPVYAPDEEIIFLSQPKETGSADIQVSGVVNNHSPEDETVRVSAELLDGEGGTLCLPEETLHVPAGGSAPFALFAILKRARTWSPQSPFLYTLRVSVRGRWTADNQPIRVGLRTCALSADKGFFLNGERLTIKGVCVHHDAGCLGAAVWPAVWQRRLKKLKDMGCNAIRMAHNPHMPELYSLCDEMGFLVMDEAFDEWEGPKNKWSTGHNVYPPKHCGYYEDFPTWHEADLSMMVKRDRNHPSVVLWSIGNEVDYPNDPYGHPLFHEMAGNNDGNKPKAEMQYSENKPNMRRLAAVARRLCAIVRKHDTTRPVLAAAAFPELSSQLGFFDVFDAIGYNYKEHLYEADHRRFPTLPIFGSENGHSLAAWQAVTGNEYIAGQFLWTGIDFLGETQGWPCHGSRAGLLDIAGYEKPGYYRRQSLWSALPMARLYIAPADQPPQRVYGADPGEPLEVICYTNLPEAELFENGRSLGVKRRGPDMDHVAWEIPFSGGTLHVVARGDAVTAEDSLRTPLPPARLSASIWETPVHLAYEGGGYTLRQLEVSVLDVHGGACPGAEPLLHFSVEGPGKLLGIENGDLSDTQEYALPRRRAHQGRAVAYVLLPKGADETAIRISSVGLPSVTVHLA